MTNRLLAAAVLLFASSTPAQINQRSGGCPSEIMKDPIVLGSNQWLRTETDLRDSRSGLGAFLVTRTFAHAST